MSAPLEIATLDAEMRTALRRLILTLADSKRLMGIRYSDWILGSPSVETGIAVSSMTQDEWGHARLLYAMLKELDIDPVPVEHERPAEEYANLDPLDSPFPDWAATTAAMVIVDGALSIALESLSRGGFEPARSRVPKMLAEEEFHVSLGAAWYRRLADASREAKGLLREASRAMLPPVLAWLGASDEAAQALVAAGVTAPGVDQVGAFRDAVRDVLQAAGIDVDAAEPAEEWEPVRGRGPGRPDADSVERARGDRNRALLVE
jgi:phenylacetate-CoA oxygenase PaaI subunit